MVEDSHRLLLQLLDTLPFDHRHAVVGREICELSFAEMATEYEKPVSTVEDYYLAGMCALHAAFERWKAKPWDDGALPRLRTLDALLELVRTSPPPPVPAEEMERGWRLLQQ